MKPTYLFMLVLSGFALTTVSVAAADLTDNLIETVKPITRAYPGVNASFIGMRTGMTVSQIEAAAIKDKLGKPQVMNSTQGRWGSHFGNAVKPFTTEIVYNLESDKSPVVKVYFTSPTTGNRSYAIFIGYYYYLKPATEPKDAPKAFIAKLKQRFGPVSQDRQNPSDFWGCWNFSKGSLVKTTQESPYCYPTGMGQASDNQHSNQDLATKLLANLGLLRPAPVDFYIAADVDIDPKQNKVDELILWLGDFQAPRIDLDEATKQLNNFEKTHR